MRHRALVVGLGAAAAPHLKSLLDLRDRVEIAAAFSRSAERRAAIAASFPELRVTADLEPAIADPSIDLAFVLTPPDAREELVGRLAAAGKHVLCEKPLERTTSAAERIVRRCAAAGVRLAVMLQMRARETSRTLRGLLERGELGRQAFVELRVPWWRPQAYYDEPGRGTLARDGGGVLVTQAIHALDLMLHLLGPVREVTAVAGTTPLHRMEGEDFAAAGLVFADGTMGSLLATTAAWPGGPEELRIVGDAAVATLVGGTLELLRPDGSRERLGEPTGTGGGAAFMDFPHDWHRAVIADFLDAVEEGREPASSGRSALAVHRLIDALLLSARRGLRLRVES
jgi:predicted dehydrogenase